MLNRSLQCSMPYGGRHDHAGCCPMIVRHGDSPCGSMLQGGSESATTWLVFGETARAMTDASDMLPNDVDALRALLATALADHMAAVAERAAAVAERDAIRA